MSKTLATIRQDVRHYLDETAEADWKDVDINRLINKYYHRVATAVMETYESYYMTEATSDTVADQQEYALPSDFFKLKRVEINYDIDGSPTSFVRAFPFSMDEARRSINNPEFTLSTSSESAYYVHGNTIGFIPVPTKNGDEAIKIWYVKYLTDMDDDADTIDIPYPDANYSIISKFAAAESLRKGQQEVVEGQRLYDEANKDLLELKRLLEDRVSEEGKRIVDTDGGSLDFGLV